LPRTYESSPVVLAIKWTQFCSSSVKQANHLFKSNQLIVLQKPMRPKWGWFVNRNFYSRSTCTDTHRMPSCLFFCSILKHCFL